MCVKRVPRELDDFAIAYISPAWKFISRDMDDLF